MRLSLIISRFPNLLFSLQKTNQRNLVKSNLQKYLVDGNINRLFYGKNENKIWGQVEELIGVQKVEQMKKTIAPLKPVFSLHWHRTSKHLLRWKKYFQNNHLLLQRVVFNINNLIGVENFRYSEIPIYLVANPCNGDKEISARFSWTPKESFIVVEIPLGLKVSNNFFPLSVLAHEFFHLMLRKNKSLCSKISKIAEENEKLLARLSKGIPSRMFLEELLVSSFIPEGYLGEKHLGIKVNIYTPNPKKLLDWRRLIAFKLQNTTKKYISNAQQINKKYLDCIIDIIRQNTK